MAIKSRAISVPKKCTICRQTWEDMEDMGDMGRHGSAQDVKSARALVEIPKRCEIAKGPTIEEKAGERLTRTCPRVPFPPFWAEARMVP